MFSKLKLALNEKNKITNIINLKLHQRRHSGTKIFIVRPIFKMLLHLKSVYTLAFATKIYDLR